MDNRPDTDEVYDGEAAALAEMIQTDGWKVFVRKAQEAIERGRDSLESQASTPEETNIKRGVVSAIRMMIELPADVIAGARKKR